MYAGFVNVAWGGGGRCTLSLTAPCLRACMLAEKNARRLYRIKGDAKHGHTLYMPSPGLKKPGATSRIESQGCYTQSHPV